MENNNESSEQYVPNVVIAHKDLSLRQLFPLLPQVYDFPVRIAAFSDFVKAFDYSMRNGCNLFVSGLNWNSVSDGYHPEDAQYFFGDLERLSQNYGVPVLIIDGDDFSSEANKVGFYYFQTPVTNQTFVDTVKVILNL